MIRLYNKKRVLLYCICISYISCSKYVDIPVYVINELEPYSIFEAISGDDIVLGYPISCGYDSSGNVYVLDSVNAQVYVIDSLKNIVQIFGGRGSGPGELAIMSQGADRSNLCVNDHFVVVADNSSRTLNIYSKDGTFITNFRRQYFPYDMCFTKNDSIIALAVDSPDYSIIEYNISGDIQAMYGDPISSIDYGTRHINQSCITCLQDGTIALYNIVFSTLTLYQNKTMLSSVYVNWYDVFRSIDEDKILMELYKQQLKWNPEDIVTRDEIIEKIPLVLDITMTSINNSVWLASHNKIFSINMDGSINTIYEIGVMPRPMLSFDLYKSGITIVDPYNAAVLIGTLK